jgi:hypothetical protein
MDQFLSPEYGVNAWRIATAGDEPTLAQPREPNPEREEGTVAPHLDAACWTLPRRGTVDDEMRIAVQWSKLEQELLVRLSAAYQIDSVVALECNGQRSEVGRSPAILRQRLREEEHDCIERNREPLHLLDGVGGIRRCRGEPHPDLHLSPQPTRLRRAS